MAAKLAWFAVYGALALLPAAAMMLVAHPPWRAPAIEAAAAMGYVGLALFVLQFAATGRFRRLSGPFGLDEIMRLHRAAGVFAAALVALHPVLLLTTEPDFIAYFDPRVNAPRALALSAALVLLAVVAVAPFLRKRLSLDHGRWRLVHGLAALGLVAIGTAHVWMVGHHTAEPWKRAVWVFGALAAFALLAHTRLVRPWRAARLPWRVAAIERVADRTWSLELEAMGHAGLDFQPGQFAWITLADSPFALEQHPFSLTSSAERPTRLAFAIKELGDFTKTIGSVPIGRRAHVFGPYGTFDLPRDPNIPLVLLAGGIGIAPFLGMLRTLRDRGERREVLLIYGVARADLLAFRRELASFAELPGVRVVLVLEEPPPEWEGEKGLMDEALLSRHVTPELVARARFYACGPPPMLKALGPTLAEFGVARSRFIAERFDVL